MIDAVASTPIFPVACVAFAFLLGCITSRIIGRDGVARRPHLPARARHHEPGHARGGPLAIAPPRPDREVLYEANARSELVRQHAARVHPHIAGELRTDRWTRGGRS